VGSPDYADPLDYPNVFMLPEFLDYTVTTNRGGRLSYSWQRQFFPLLGNSFYSGEQSIYAGYAMADAQITPWLRLIGGLRYEVTDLSIVSSVTHQALPMPRSSSRICCRRRR